MMERSPILQIVLILLVAILFQGCQSITPEEIEKWVKNEIPIGSSKTIVVAKLEEKKISHSANHQPHLYYDKSKTFNASIPNTSKGVLNRGGIYMQFSFDENDKLISYKVEEVLTGL